MNKKWILFLMVMMSLSTLMACRGQSQNQKIVIWHDKETAIETVIYDILEEKLPDIEVELIRRESLTDTLKLVGNNPTSAPDMYIFAHDKIGLFSEIGILAPITDFVSQDILDEFLDITIEAATYKNVMYQLPFYYETLLFMYNRSRMQDHMVPQTTEALYTYMKNVTNSRRYGFVEQHSNAYYSVGWIHGFGGRILDDQGRPNLDDPKTISALAYHLKFLKYMPVGQAEYATVNTLFFESRADSIIAGPWIVPTARERGIDLGFAPMPIVDETGLPLSPYAGIQGIHVLKVAANNADKKQKITQILNVLSDPEVGIQMALSTGAAPAHESAYLDERILSDAMIMAMKQAADQAIPMPNLPQMDIMWTTTSNMLVEINMRNVDIAKAVRDAQKRSEELIDMMN